jgi:hypothetical protein
MQLTYRGLSYTPHTRIVNPQAVTLTYRGVTFERTRALGERTRPEGLIYRGQKCNCTDTPALADRGMEFAL